MYRHQGVVYVLGINPRLVAGYLHTYYCWAKKISPAHCIWIVMHVPSFSKGKVNSYQLGSLIFHTTGCFFYPPSSSWIIGSPHSFNPTTLTCPTLLDSCSARLPYLSRFSSPAWLQRAVAAAEGHQHAYVGENSSHALSQGTPPLSDGFCVPAVWGAKTSPG